MLAHGCVACSCGCGWWMGVWTHCVQTDEGKEKKKRKEKPWMMVVDAGRWECGCVACADALCVHMDAYERKKKERKKEQKNLLMGLPRMCTQRHGHVDDHVGVWMRMCCMQMWMSIKEKEKKKKPTLLMQMVDVWACGHVAC